jgi:hypothetical protein
MKNLWSKTVKQANAYYVVDQRGWTTYVLKVWGDPRKPYARAFCLVITPMTGPGGDLGDVYAADIPGLTQAWLRAHTPPQEGGQV